MTSEDEDNQATSGDTEALITPITPIIHSSRGGTALSKAHTIYEKEKTKIETPNDICQAWVEILKAFFFQDLSPTSVRLYFKMYQPSY